MQRQIIGQRDFGGNLHALALGLNGAIIHATRQLVQAVAPSAKQVQQHPQRHALQIADGAPALGVEFGERFFAHA